jgi:hypothetical protein
MGTYENGGEENREQLLTFRRLNFDCVSVRHELRILRQGKSVISNLFLFFVIFNR